MRLQSRQYPGERRQGRLDSRIGVVIVMFLYERKITILEVQRSMAKQTSTEIATHPRTEALWDFDRVFDDLSRRISSAFGFVPFGPLRASGLSGYRAAPVDVKDTGKAYVVLAEVPGIPKDRLDIRVRGSLVEIRADNETSEEKKQDGYLRQERSYQGFYRAFELPEPVMGEKANAHVKDGGLELELPKQNPSPAPEGTRVKVA